MTSTWSPAESARFGRRIGRLDLEAPVGAAEAGRAVEEAFARHELDVLIVRTPAEDLATPGLLASLPAFQAVPAGTLLYWDWRWDGVSTHDDAVSSTEDPELIEQLVREVFAGYTNHYAANPLFSAEVTVDGYVEWANTLVASGAASCITGAPDEHGRTADPVGLAIVDWSGDPPDVKLAGVRPQCRGQGTYRQLLALVMAEAVRRGHRAVQISTQAHNTQVMRAWADLGWRPRRSVAVTHLVRADLLQPPPSP